MESEVQHCWSLNPFISFKGYTGSCTRAEQTGILLRIQRFVHLCEELFAASTLELPDLRDFH